MRHQPIACVLLCLDMYLSDYLLVTRCPSDLTGFGKRNLCLGHFTRIVNINTSRRH